MSIERFEIPESLDGERADRALALLLDRPRSAAVSLIESGAATVSGVAVAKSHRLVAGDVLVVVDDEGEVTAGPEPSATVPVEIRYSDDDIIVVAKQAGIVVHPGAGHATGTLVEGLLRRYPEIRTVGEPQRPGIVHRLDRDTSGLLVVARTGEAYESLVAQLATRQVERRYLVLVWGSPEAEKGLIDAPIGRSERKRTRMAVRGSGREARTGYEVLERFQDPPVTLLRCRLETGRTHQIRVHCAAIEHPVVGDAEYGGVRTTLRLDRMFLHAETLRFEHPRTGEALSFEEPLPGDLEEVLRALRSGSVL